jgi:putative endonuclease
MAEWQLYMVRCRDGSLYTGITTDVPRRLAEHQKSQGPGAKYLRGRAPLSLVFQMELSSKSLALSVEIQIKKLPKAKKEDLIRDKAGIEAIITRARSNPKKDKSGTQSEGTT